jgi:SAM-dependent methyltransferase
MPTSAWHYLSPIMDEIARLHAIEPVRSILDVGCGAGKWGFLARDLLDHYHHCTYDRTDWPTRIDGVEAFERYRTPVHDHVYDEVHWGNAIDVVPSLGTYDVIIAMEVIEHLDKAAGLALLDALLARCRRVLFLSFPPEYDGAHHHVLEQKAVHGNPFEEHRSVWTEEDLAARPNRLLTFQTFVLEGRSTAPAVVRDRRAGRGQTSPVGPALYGRLPLRYRVADALNDRLKRVPLVHAALKSVGSRLGR